MITVSSEELPTTTTSAMRYRAYELADDEVLPEDADGDADTTPLRARRWSSDAHTVPAAHTSSASLHAQQQQ